MEPMGAVVCS